MVSFPLQCSWTIFDLYTRMYSSFLSSIFLGMQADIEQYLSESNSIWQAQHLQQDSYAKETSPPQIKMQEVGTGQGLVWLSYK